jgi:hypothetical protein
MANCDEIILLTQVSTTSERTGTGDEFGTGERRGTVADLGVEIIFLKLKPIQ